MANANVGAGILNIITESLYDKPIVVFREYVQNSVDSFVKAHGNTKELESQIWVDGSNLYFLDNGDGIEESRFLEEMVSIARSEKRRTENIGYKGIGRLSGLPYCRKLIFINIKSYQNNVYQKYIMDGDKYDQIKAEIDKKGLSFTEVMDEIGSYCACVNGPDISTIKGQLAPFHNMFVHRDTGFFVTLEDINLVLSQTINKPDFLTELGWLLPVKFSEEIFVTKESQLFQEMITVIPETSITPAKSFNIYYNHTEIQRPIRADMLRTFTCKTVFSDYAVGFHTFSHDKIQVAKSNIFSGIKLYVDNVLLCDENELLPILQQYGLINHSANELIQSVKGVGSVIYIIDKVNISTNARRTFIEVTDDDSLAFLQLLAEFVKNIYEARYALSRYYAGKNSAEESTVKLQQLKDTANEALRKLAKDEITIDYEDNYPRDFGKLTLIEQKQVVKRRLSSYINQKIKDYLSQTSVFNYQDTIKDFCIWFSSNK